MTPPAPYGCLGGRRTACWTGAWTRCNKPHYLDGRGDPPVGSPLRSRTEACAYDRERGVLRRFSRFDTLDVLFLGFPRFALIVEARRQGEHARVHACVPVSRLRTLDAALSLIARFDVEVWPLQFETVVFARQLHDQFPSLTTRARAISRVGDAVA